MALETGNFVTDLQQTNPPGTDKKKQGDDHLRLIKSVLKQTFPNGSRAQYFPRSRAVAASGGIAATDMAAVIAADATAGVVNLSLPTLTSGDDGWFVTVIKSDASVNVVTATGTVNGISGFSLTRQFEGGMFIWGGAAWFGVRFRPFIVTGDLQANSVTDTILRDSAQVSVIGRSVNSVGDPGDIIAASDGLVLFRNGNVLQFGQIGALGITDGIITPTKLTLEAAALSKGLYHIRDQRTSGTDGDALTSGIWNTRTLQTEITDDLTITLGSSQFALVAGTYKIKASAVAYFAGSTEPGGTQAVESKLRLRNVTDATTAAVGNAIRRRDCDDGGGNRQSVESTLISTMEQRFTIGGTKTFELQNWITSTLTGTVIAASQRGGKAISSGESEVYADVEILKVG